MASSFDCVEPMQTYDLASHVIECVWKAFYLAKESCQIAVFTLTILPIKDNLKSVYLTDA